MKLMSLKRLAGRLLLVAALMSCLGFVGLSSSAESVTLQSNCCQSCYDQFFECLNAGGGEQCCIDHHACIAGCEPEICFDC